ncbi:MAG: FMN-binding negative transcriptional regulator [Pseudomonadota bacterium]
MHPNPAFRQTPEDRNIAFARARSFGMLAVNGVDGAPLLSHIPFQLSEDGTYVEAHLVRSNPILGLAKAPVDAVIAVSGGDAYISPDWYGVEDQVPTWNYVAVHLRGRLKVLDQTELHGILERLSAGMEKRLDGKKPWVIDKMDQDVYTRMQRQIVPIAMDVTEINGTWKLSQNKPDEARMGAADGVDAARMGSEIETVTRLMREAD